VLDSRDPSRFIEGKWQPRGWMWVDPLKDVQAGILGIGAGLASRTGLLSDQGVDPEEVFEELSEEKKLADALKLDLTVAAKAPVVDKGPKDTVSDDEEETADESAGTKAAAAGGSRVIQLGGGR
jgi:capsid protein